MILQMKKVLLDPHIALVILLKKGVFILKLNQVTDRNKVHEFNICIRGCLIHSNNVEKREFSSQPNFFVS